MGSSIRLPAVAGSFYPKEKERLSSQLESFFKKAKKIAFEEKPRILIVPHAGIVYSGETAASGFSSLVGKKYQRIVLLGQSHHFFFEEVAIDDSDLWQTPLGQIEIDREFGQRLINRSKNIIFESKPHLPEHDLEVELIFLQKILKDFKVVPILVSQPSLKTVEDLAKALEKNFDNQTLLLVSTDLSHYPSAEVAEKVDAETVKAILAGDPAVFEKKVREIEEKNRQQIETAICGFEAVRAALKFARLLGIERFQLLDYSNSGRVTNDNRQVVGYASIVGLQKSLSSTLKVLDKEKKVIDLVKTTLKNYFEKKESVSRQTFGENLKKTGFGVFVTLKKDGVLRGCMGEFESKEPLYLAIEKTSLKSAFSDPRFSPLMKDEVNDLEVEISILSPLKKISNWREVRVGRDGVVVRQGNFSGTYLPQVAEKTDWTTEEFLSSLCSEKAGLSESCYSDPKTEIFVFQIEKIVL